MSKARSRTRKSKKIGSDRTPKDDVIAKPVTTMRAAFADTPAIVGDELAELEAGWDELLA